MYECGERGRLEDCDDVGRANNHTLNEGLAFSQPTFFFLREPSREAERMDLRLGHAELLCTASYYS